MAAQSYQVTRDVNIVAQQVEAFQIIASVALNAVEGYGLTVLDVSMDGAGRLRIRLSAPFPAGEVESFAGDIIAV